MVRQALEKGYTITSIGVLCWTKAPTPELAPRLLARILILEAVFTIFFYACRETIMDELFIPDYFLWKRENMTWDPACTHLSLSDDVRLDMSLTAEELKMADETRRLRATAKSQRYRKRKRDEDEEAYQQHNRDLAKAYKAKNPQKILDLAKGVADKARRLERFRCNLCELNLKSQSDLDAHYTTATHAAAVQQGGKVIKVVSEAGLRKAARDAAAKANKDFYCEPCKKACSNASDLKRHQSKKKHLDTVAAAASS